MIQYITLDDNPIHLTQLTDKLALIPNTTLVQKFTNPLEALEFLKVNQVNVVFMDIEMPELSGIELAKQLVNPPLFVFISSHRAFGEETYEIDAVDYIIKPVSIERLLKSFRKIYQLIELKSQASNELKIEADTSDSFFIKENSLHVKLFYNDVLYAESLNAFIQLYLNNGKKHLVLVGLKQFEDQIPSNKFVRISRTHILNKSKITAYSNTQVYIGSLSFAIGNTYANHLLKNVFANTTIARFSNH